MWSRIYILGKLFLIIFVSDIMQWAVLAIRNLCEGNATNQEVIARLETRGVAEATVEEFRPGCEVEVTRRGKLRMKGN